MYPYQSRSNSPTTKKNNVWTSFWCDNCLGSFVCHLIRSIPPPTLSNGRARKGNERARKEKPAICLFDWILHVWKIGSRKLLCYPYTHCMFTCTSIHGNDQKERELTQKKRELRQKKPLCIFLRTLPNLPTFNYFPSLYLQKGQLFPPFIRFHAHVFHRPRLLFQVACPCVATRQLNLRTKNTRIAR